jgi:hypothetical protein
MRVGNVQSKVPSESNGEAIHIRAYVLNPYRFSICPTCQELTIERTSQIGVFVVDGQKPTLREERSILTTDNPSARYSTLLTDAHSPLPIFKLEVF